MADTTEAEESLAGFAADVSERVRNFLSTTAQVASGGAEGAEISLLLLATSDVLAVGARLGASVDIVPVERFEPDAGPETDLDPLREGLARQLDNLDDYAEIVDPLLGVEIGRSSISEDLASMADMLAKGLQHFDAGQVREAMWWWQFSYMSSWGERAASALRVLQLILAHSRLDVDDDVAAEAEYDALHG